MNWLLEWFGRDTVLVLSGLIIGLAIGYAIRGWIAFYHKVEA